MAKFSDIRTKRLKEAIEASGIKQNVIADRLDVDPNTVTRWLKGAKPQGRRRQRELSRILGVRWRWLFDETYIGPKDIEHPYEQSAEEIGPPATDRDHLREREEGRFKVSVRDDQRSCSPDEHRYVEAVREVLRSGEHGTIVALQSNIIQFQEQVRERVQAKERDTRERRLLDQNQRLLEQNRELSERVAELERAAWSTKNERGTQARDPSLINNTKKPTHAPRTKDDDIQSSGD